MIINNRYNSTSKLSITFQLIIFYIWYLNVLYLVFFLDQVNPVIYNQNVKHITYIVPSKSNTVDIKLL